MTGSGGNQMGVACHIQRDGSSGWGGSDARIDTSYVLRKILFF